MNNISAHLALLGCNLFWALSYPMYKVTMPHFIGPLPLLTIVLVVAALFSLISFLFRGNGEGGGGRSKITIFIERQDVGAIIIAGILITVIRKGLLVFGLSLTSPIDGSIIFTISPVVVLVISVVVGLERFSTRKTLGMLLGMAGAVGVILTSASSANGGAGVAGNVMVFCCAFITAIYVVWFKRLLEKYDPIVVLRWVFIVGAIVIIPIGLHSVLEVDFSKFTPHVWIAFIYLITIPTFFSNLLLTVGLRRVAPSTASIYNYIQPAVAVSSSVALGLDALHLTTMLCGALIFVGVGMVIKK